MQTNHSQPPIPDQTVSPRRANEADAPKHLPTRLVVVALDGYRLDADLGLVTRHSLRESGRRQ